MRDIVKYQTAAGKEPFNEWLKSLDWVSQARIDAYVFRASLGSAKRNIRHVGGGVYEIKSTMDRDIASILQYRRARFSCCYLAGPREARTAISGRRSSIGGTTLRRTPSYNEELSRRLKKPRYAREFIAALMEGPEGLTAEDAVRQMIRIMGVKEFSEATGMRASNVVAFVKGRRQPKRETLDLLLKPFKLRTRIILERAS